MISLFIAIFLLKNLLNIIVKKLKQFYSYYYLNAA